MAFGHMSCEQDEKRTTIAKSKIITVFIVVHFRTLDGIRTRITPARITLAGGTIHCVTSVTISNRVIEFLFTVKTPSGNRDTYYLHLAEARTVLSSSVDPLLLYSE
jgi:hypothetical protein